MTVPLVTGLAVVGIGVVFAGVERIAQRRLLRRVPLRIHVGGARGKSTVTRMIAAGLRAGGKVVVAKTTGSLPQLVLPTGEDAPWKRRGTPRVGEQLRLLRVANRLGAEVLVAENMGVQREYLWIGQHRLLAAQVGVITNLRPDHLSAWGRSQEEIADALSLSIPRNGSLYLPRDEAHPIVLERARQMGTRVVLTNPAPELRSRGRLEGGFGHNAELACAVCHDVGVPRDIVMKAILAYDEDPGASSVWSLSRDEGPDLRFLLLFAANDPVSTLQARAEMVCTLGWSDEFTCERVANLLNLRGDRHDRTLQWAEALADDPLGARLLLLTGDVTAPVERLLRGRLPGFRVERAPERPQVLAASLSSRYPEIRFVVGMGNIAGPAWDLIGYLETKGERVDR